MLVAVTATVRLVDGVDRVRLNAAYIRALEDVSLVPLVVPPLSDMDAALRILDVVSGLVLSGGEDLDPALYGDTPHPALGPVNCPRDFTELALLAGARERGLPTLAICRGIQVVNVGLGGTLPDVAFWLMPALALLIGCNVVVRVRRGVAAAAKAGR